MTLSIGALTLVPIAGCSSDDADKPKDSADAQSPDGQDGQADEDAAADTDSDATSDASKCCPLTPPPTRCSEMAMGGTRPANGKCGHYYDNIGPVQLYTNEDGCPVYGNVTDPDAALDYINDCPTQGDAGEEVDAESDASPE